jgi:beta-lactamase regulating signal transducer with metallopeptidase domain
MGTLNQLVETFVLNALWQVALVTGLAAASARLLGRAPARYRHVLWVMALVFSLLLPLAAVRDAWKAENHQPDFKLSASTRLNGQQLGSGTGSESPGQESQGLPAKLVTSVGTREGSRPWFVNPLHHHAQPIALPPVAAKTMLCIFLFSLFSQLTRIVRAWRRTRQLCRRAAARQLPPAMAALMVRCQTALGLKRVVLRSSSEVTGPATAGFFRPVIILPESLFETAPSEELASALCHEMAHIRRRDYIANLICELLFLPLAFHPLAWLLKRRIDETRELACDEAAAARLQGAAAYARSLVRLAHSLVPVPLTTRYTLGVFDANILEERIMRLLDKRPQVSGRVARLIFGGTVLVLALGALAAGAFSLAAVASAPPQEVSRTPADFSGRWELDASQSDLPLPAPANLVEEIDQHGSQLKITTTSKDWNATKPVAVTLFALLDPEFSTTADNRESVQPFGPGQIRAKTRWEDGNLVTDWQLERSSQVAVIGRWVRHLSPDGMTQTVDISAHDPTRNVDGKAKAVFVKRAHDAAAFLGTWQSEFQGKRFLTLVLREDGQQITGTLSPFIGSLRARGNRVIAQS